MRWMSTEWRACLRAELRWERVRWRWDGISVLGWGLLGVIVFWEGWGDRGRDDCRIGIWDLCSLGRLSV